MEQKNRTWAEISLPALEKNYKYLRSLAPHSKFLGLCKADAYGHGGLIIGKALEKFGAEYLAVASVEEGIALREGGIKIPILSLGEPPSALFPSLLAYQITPTIQSVTKAKELSQLAISQGKSSLVHVKVDTGMGRLGMIAEKPEEVVTEIKAIATLPQIMVEGVYTHFSQSDQPEGKQFTQEQFTRFLAIKEGLAGTPISLFHTANSGATLSHPATHLDMIRAGISLYGYSPDGKVHPQLTPVLTVKSRVLAIKTLPKGWNVGYGGICTLQRDTIVAVLPVGYGDGYPRNGIGKEILLGGERCPVLGRVCMDMTMIDVTDLEGSAEVGQVATLFGRENLLIELAKKTETITYDLLCRITSRVPRVVSGEKP